MWEEVVQAVCSPLWAPLVVAELLCIIVFFFSAFLHAWKPAQLQSSLVCEAE